MRKCCIRCGGRKNIAAASRKRGGRIANTFIEKRKGIDTNQRTICNVMLARESQYATQKVVK